MSSAELAALLETLERRLHGPGGPGAEQLLHPDFLEHGRSGRRYDKAAMLALLAQDSPGGLAVWAQDFDCQALAPDLALLSYRSAHQGPDGTLCRHSLRASLWQRSAAGDWQMRFHQGTACEPFEAAGSAGAVPPQAGT